MEKHVLLIEDEPNIAEAIRFLLTRAGLRVSHLAEGASALAAMRADRPDLVILDHMLPGSQSADTGQSMRHVLCDWHADASPPRTQVLRLSCAPGASPSVQRLPT